MMRNECDKNLEKERYGYQISRDLPHSKDICSIKRIVVSLFNKNTIGMSSQYPSILLENAVNEFAKLPGIGKKTALRLVLHLLRQDAANVEKFISAIATLKQEIKYCSLCHNISDSEVCSICADKSRDPSLICVVENVKEVMAIEGTMQFKGLYHVLGGIISPIDGIGPSDLEIDSLAERVKTDNIEEVILALSATMEGDTTNFYIYRKLQPYNVKVSIIARGVSIGDEIEYADEVTLGRSILNRTPFDETYKSTSK
jgi:recombination protein RecR